jgi:hypothetical protein
MDANDALKLMVAPSQKRPGIWYSGIIQIMVTRACDESCVGCTQGSNLAGKPAMMSVEQFEEACASLEGYWGLTGLFGGNCCLHPKFDELCKIMRAYFPFRQRGIWTNNLMGKGKYARVTFDPAHSNLNCHMNTESYEEFVRDWPESKPYLKGHDKDSIHVTPWVAMRDVIPDEEKRWELISKCDINQTWSALLGVHRGKLTAWFCEVAYAMAALHENNPDWCGSGQAMPDVGLPATPGWWRKPIADFAEQVNTCCHACGVPMRRPGLPAIGGDHEEFSETHRFIARPKVKSRPVEIVTIGGLAERPERPATQYLPNVTPRYRGD